MIRIVSWNMAHKIASWAALDDVPADVALVQEAGKPEPSWARSRGDSSNPLWETALVAGRGPWRTAVLKLSDAVELQARPAMTLETATSADDWVVSRAGSIAAADITVGGQYVFTAVSVTRHGRRWVVVDTPTDRPIASCPTFRRSHWTGGCG